MTNLSTRWLGLALKSPIVVGASPISRDLQAVKEAVAAGAGAVVMHSLFEEQFVREQMSAHWFFEAQAKRDAAAFGAAPGEAFSFQPDDYLREVETLRRSVEVPIIASMNGSASGSWLSHARQIEGAGASAIELNLYEIVTSPEVTGESLEQRQESIVQALVKEVAIPVTVKLQPFYSSLPSFVRRLETVGALGVTVFNRVYGPARDPLAVAGDADVLSSPAELPLRLRALAVLSASAGISLACTGGVHSGLDVARAVLSGAHVVELASVLLRNGPNYVGVVEAELRRWMEANGYTSIHAARGVRSFPSVSPSSTFPRLEYAHMLESWRPSK